MKLILSRQTSKEVLGVYGLLLIVILLFAVISPGSFSIAHLLDVIRQASPLGIIAIGQTLVLLVAGIDLSVGATISLVNVLAASIMLGDNGNILTAVLFTLLISATIGLINGLAITFIRIPSFLVTLSMSLVIQGIYLVYTKGSPKGNIAPAFRVISDGWWGPIPVASIIWIGIWLLFAFLLYRTIWGRRIYATGGNIQTSRLSGIGVNRVVVTMFVLSALLAGITGLMISAYIGVASNGVGNIYTLNSIAATVIGGTAFSGGKGGLAGTFAGVLIMVLLQSLMTVMNIPEAGKYMSQGVIIAVMVGINQRRTLSRS
ncbi:ribose ABC transporter permease [Paenibacillus marchantiophytorum]|uniref:Autoinducer 2 import system permease protein LsrD n=1 Tax=Paenibacillus marchantiophytorum TaxID=1619310 RepID=A0ABQ1ENH5_9BACL|nr:ABC transporter permease [Paenibacillus marchantiophytorum]GFZ78775.1 ribose ABC transporter permease [Paenibacillus marchantiophytorum]